MAKQKTLRNPIGRPWKLDAEGNRISPEQYISFGARLTKEEYSEMMKGLKIYKDDCTKVHRTKGSRITYLLHLNSLYLKSKNIS